MLEGWLLGTSNRMDGSGVYEDEAALVERAREGDEGAWRVLFERHRDVAYRVAWRMVGRQEDALDVVQDSFIRAFQGLRDFAGASSFRTWLLRIVSRRAVDVRRSRRRRASVSLDGGSGDAARDLPDGDAAADPTSRVERADLAKRLARVLDELPPEQREAFVLHADGGMKYADIAEVQQVAIGTVMSRIYYARHRLREMLADLAETHEAGVRKDVQR